MTNNRNITNNTKLLNQQRWSADHRPFLMKYGLALSSILYILIPTFYHSNTLWTVSPFLILIPSIIITAWYGGLLPGILATGVGLIIGDYFFTHPYFTFAINNSDDILREILFGLIGLLISILSQVLHNALAKARQDAELIKELDNQKSTFLSIVAHELKTPIAIMRVITHVLTEQPVPTKNNEPLQDLNSELERLTMIVDDLLDLSRIEKGTLHINKTTIDLTKTIFQVVKHMRKVGESHKILWKSPTTVLISADEPRIKQVLINLIENAIKHSPKKTSITIEMKTNSKDVIVSVEDHGTGISSKEQSLIFDKFYQVKDPNTKGFGLGLYISKEIINQHGGTMLIHSKKGQGSTFSFTLPLK